MTLKIGILVDLFTLLPQCVREGFKKMSQKYGFFQTLLTTPARTGPGPGRASTESGFENFASTERVPSF